MNAIPVEQRCQCVGKEKSGSSASRATSSELQLLEARLA